MQFHVEYLGHIVDRKGLHANPEKVKAIVDAPCPRDVPELRAFLGLLNYYGKFLPNLAGNIHPLNNLLCKTKKWNWTEACKKSFNWARQAIASSRILVHYDPKLPIKVAADASAYGIGAVFSQIDKEALALIFAVKKFHQYLYGRHFTLVTDHKPLLAILGPKKGIPPLAASRLQRWAFQLSAYTYDIEFKRTTDHCNADGLSRLPIQQNALEQEVSEITQFNIGQIQALPISSLQIQKATQTDPILCKVYRFIQTGWPTQIPDINLTMECNCVMYGIRVVIPRKLQEPRIALNSPRNSANEGPGTKSYMVAWLRSRHRTTCESMYSVSKSEATTCSSTFTSMDMASSPLAEDPCGFCRSIFGYFFPDSG